MAMQVQTQLNATDSQLGALQARATELRAKMTVLESRMTTAPEVEREYQIVNRDLASARAKYDELLKRQMDAEVSEAAIAGGTADKFRVASSPNVPEKPAKPQRIAIVHRGGGAWTHRRHHGHHHGAAPRSDRTRRSRHSRYSRRHAADRRSGHSIAAETQEKGEALAIGDARCGCDRAPLLHRVPVSPLTQHRETP